MFKVGRLVRFCLAMFALSAGSLAKAETDAGTSTAEETVRLLVSYCLVSHTATSLQATLIEDRWSRVGGIPSADNAGSDDETRQRLEEAKAQLDRWRTFTSEELPHILTFTTPDQEPDKIADCIVDGEDLQVEHLVRLLVRTFGLPVQERPGSFKWFNLLDSGKMLSVEESMIVGNDNGISLVVRETEVAQPAPSATGG